MQTENMGFALFFIKVKNSMNRYKSVVCNRLFNAMLGLDFHLYLSIQQRRNNGIQHI